MKKFITKEEVWVLSEYREAYDAIMGHQDEHRKKLEAVILDYYNKNMFVFPDLNTDLFNTRNIDKITKMESVFQLARIIGSKLELDAKISHLVFAYHTIEGMYGEKEACKHRDDYTLWVDFLVSFYFNRITQWEVDSSESIGDAQ